MNFRAPCAVCAKQKLDVKDLNWCVGELDDNGVAYLTCNKAHESAFVFEAKRHEVLLRSGGKALLAGFSSEAISSLSSALERAYEFYIRVICSNRGIEVEPFEVAWKSVGAQSERQLGAFTFLYLLDTGAHLALDPKIPETRNRIVHHGRIARTKDAMEFGERVYSRILAIEQAYDGYAETVEKVLAQQLEAQIATIPKGMEYGKMKVWTKLIKGNEVVGDTTSFAEYLEALRGAVEKGLA